MTYCVAVMVDSGIVFASDSRTNAGVDHIAVFRKMRVFERSGDRVVVLLSSGNLSMSQGVVHLLNERAGDPDDPRNIWAQKSMYDVTSQVGDALRDVQDRHEGYLKKHDIDYYASFIVGGQVQGEPPRLFRVYSEGNFIEAGIETPYFQIGETKYGKPILDRLVSHDVDLKTVSKCVLVSFDSTMRSNISVGLPIDIVSYARDSLRIGFQHKIGEDDPYFSALHRQWAEGIRRTFDNLPDPWEDDMN